MGRVALEPILFTSNFWRAKNWQKFGKFQNSADRHIRHKIYRQQNVSRVHSSQIFLYIACS